MSMKSLSILVTRLALVLLDQVDRLATHDAEQLARRGVHLDAHAGKDRGIDAADRGKRDEAVVGHVVDHHADFVDVSLPASPRRRSWCP